MTDQNLPLSNSVRKASPLENRYPQTSLPSDWTRPKYHFGQLVKHGWILGMRYYPKHSTLAQVIPGWIYEVIADWRDEECHLIPEENIEPFDPEKATKKLTEEINDLHARAAALEQQLNQLVV